MTTKAKPAPRDLGTAGRALWRDACREFTFSSVEFALLHELCTTVDEIAAMKSDLGEMGMVVSGSEHQPRINPLVPALAVHRKLADTLAAALALPVESETVGRRRSATARQNANARWKTPKSGSTILRLRGGA